MLRISVALVAICGGSVITRASDKPHEADVVVYGDASGGVTAAVQAARMGKGEKGTFYFFRGNSGDSDFRPPHPAFPPPRRSAA